MGDFFENKIVNLNKLQNVYDEINLNKGKVIKRTKEIFLDGSESWTTQRKDLDNVYAFGLTLNEAKSMANGFLILNDNNFSFIQNWFSFLPMIISQEVIIQVYHIYLLDCLFTKLLN